MKKRIISAALAVVMAASLLPLAGCEEKAEYTPGLTLSDSMPPEVAAEHGAFSANLYFVSVDGRRLEPEIRTVTYALSESLAEAVVKELILGPETEKLSASMPTSLTLDRVDISDETCSVYLKGKYPESGREWLVARAALTQTICEIEGVGSVSVFLNGADPGYLGLSLGALRPLGETLDVYLASVNNEYETLSAMLPGDIGGNVTRTAALYFSAGELLTARNSDIVYDPALAKSELVSVIMDGLSQYPLGGRIPDSALPEGLTLAAPPEVKYVLTGESVDEGEPPEEDLSCVIELEFMRMEDASDTDTLCGALTLTLTGCIANAVGVSIRFVDEAGEAGDGGYFTRADYQNMLGRSAWTFFPDADGSVLHRIACPVPSKLVNDPYSRLSMLFDEAPYPGVNYPAFTAEDVKSVYITDDIAVVDWRAGFTEKFGAMLDDESTSIPRGRLERLFVFSVVNTLCDLAGVKRVWMLEDGRKLGMIEDIYLGNALMENPGLVLDE